MYHPAKVEQVIDAGDGLVLMVQTWDRNTFTLDAAPHIEAAEVDEGDVVLLDYYPDESFDVPSPKQVVAAVLDDEDAEAVWDTYEQMFEGSQEQQTAAMGQMPNQPGFDGNYIG